MWGKGLVNTQSKPRMECVIRVINTWLGEWEFSFPPFLFPCPHTSGRGERWRANPSQMPKDWMICDEVSTETSTKQVIYDLKNWDLLKEQHRYTLHHGSLDHCGSLPRGLCLCSYFRGATLHSADSGILLKLESYCMAPMTNPSVTPQLSQSQIWILIKSYKAPHDLPPWPLCLIPFHSPPFTRSAAATLVLAAAQTHQSHFWKPLLKVSLFQSVSLTLYSLLNSHHSLSSQHSSLSAIGFSLSSLSVGLSEGILFYYILFTAVFLHQEMCLLGQKSYVFDKYLSRIWISHVILISSAQSLKTLDIVIFLIFY